MSERAAGMALPPRAFPVMGAVAGTAPRWGRLPLPRWLRIRRLRRAAAYGPEEGPRQRPDAPGLMGPIIATLERCRDASVPDAALGAALDMIEGRIADCAGPEARHAALVLAAAAFATCRRPVRIVCLSEARAAKLFEMLEPVARALRLGAALVPDRARLHEREAAYGAGIVIGSAARLAQDTLREMEEDGPARSDLRFHVRGLRDGAEAGRIASRRSVALIDDADLVMVEAPRPVGLRSDVEAEAGRLRAEEAFAILRSLEAGAHYTIDPSTRRIRLTERGEERLETFSTLFGGPWLTRKWREETIFSALTIREFFRPGEDYAVEKDGILLRRTGTPAPAQPSILDLVAAKERFDPPPRPLKLWSYRRFLAGFGHLGGVGLGVAALARDFGEGFGLRCRSAHPPLEPPPPAFPASNEARAHAVGQAAAAGALLWAPTPEDATRYRDFAAGRGIVAGEAVFSLPDAPERILQLAAAQRSWEARLRDVFPGAQIDGVAGPEDGLFAILHAETTELAAFRAAPAPATYRAAQDARARAAAARRAAHLKSERYFDRILAFAGETP